MKEPILIIGSVEMTYDEEYSGKYAINLKQLIVLLIMLFALFVFSGCGNNNEENAKTVQNQCKNQRVLTSGTLSIIIQNSGKNCPGLIISCPTGIICDENYDYRAYKYSDQDIDLYISFNPEVVGNYSLQLLKDNFDYMYFRIYFPDRQTEKSQSYYHNATLIRKLGEATPEGMKFTLDGYKEGMIQGTIEGIATEITERIESDSPECLSGDVMGTCFKYEEAHIPFSVNFNLALE